MSWTGASCFNRIYSWVADEATGLNISSTRMYADSNDIAANGFGNCLTRDGQGQPIANLPMANFRHTGVGNGVARTDYTGLGQTQDGVINWAAAGPGPETPSRRPTHRRSRRSPTANSASCAPPPPTSPRHLRSRPTD